MIYILCPFGVATGGTEALYQLCDKLLKNGHDAALLYYRQGKIVLEDAQDKDYFSNYEVRGAKSAPTSTGDVVIIPETCTHFLPKFRNQTRIIWWLSVDNYLYYVQHGIKYRMASLFGLRKKRLNPFQDGIMHAYQSEYAHEWLLKNGVDGPLPLSDYLNSTFIQETADEQDADKEDCVLYNPKKGFEFTKRLIETSQELSWVPLQGLSREQMIHRIKTAKVYVDFGNHPGKDRIPREACLGGCCIITGMEGSAGNGMDIPIPNKYKFDASMESSEIKNRIEDCIKNYDERRREFDNYRMVILQEEAVFNQEVQALAKSTKRTQNCR